MSQWFPELGVYDYRHRMYQPELGRFLQADPMGLQTEGEKLSAGQKALFSPGGVAPEAFGSSEMNLFRYCGDDPVDRSDPTGLKWIVAPDLQKQFDEARRYLSKDRGMREMFKFIDDPKNEIDVIVSKTTSLHRIDTKTEYVELSDGRRAAHIHWNPRAANSVTSGSQSPALVLGHEGFHAQRIVSDADGFIRDKHILLNGPMNFHDLEERRVILGPETQAAGNLPGEAVRDNGRGVFYDVSSVTLGR
jgi:hypothetical protein